MSGANIGTSGLPVPKRKSTGEPPVPKAARHIPRFNDFARGFSVSFVSRCR